MIKLCKEKAWIRCSNMVVQYGSFETILTTIHITMGVYEVAIGRQGFAQ